MKDANLKVKALIFTSFSLFIGCSLTQSGSSLRELGYFGGTVPMEEIKPLPVEIARDIQNLSGKGLYVIDGGRLSNGRYMPGQVVSEEDLLLRESNGPLKKGLQRRATGPLKLSRALSSQGSSGGSANPALATSGGGKTINYKVKLGDTLMEIAFEKHANYLRWKEIYQHNRNKMESPKKMQVGTVLTIKNVKYVYIKRDGRPYLIRRNDTLRSISQKLYGSPDRWKEIWRNNPQLIRNPKKIYAGFKLYYNPSDSSEAVPRVPAKEKQSD